MGVNEKGVAFIYYTKKSTDMSLFSEVASDLPKELIDRSESFTPKYLGYKNEFCQKSVAPIEKIAFFLRMNLQS